MLLFIILFCVLVALGLGIAGALSDARGLIIPNVYPAGVVMAFVPAYAAFWVFAPGSAFFQEWTSHLAAFALVFAGSFALYSFRLFGGGDSKLCTAFALWVGMKGLFAFIFYMALVGGVLGLAALILRKYKPCPNAKPGGWVERVQNGENAVPYGIAIIAGALISCAWLGYFSPERLMLLDL